jgi:hypothetical protein
MVCKRVRTHLVVFMCGVALGRVSNDEIVFMYYMHD